MPRISLSFSANIPIIAHRGGADTELRDEIAAQEDARKDAEEARAEGDEHPVGQTFTERATGGANLDVGSTGTLSEEFADKEGRLPVLFV